MDVDGTLLPPTRNICGWTTTWLVVTLTTSCHHESIQYGWVGLYLRGEGGKSFNTPASHATLSLYIPSHVHAYLDLKYAISSSYILTARMTRSYLHEVVKEQFTEVGRLA